MSNTELERQLFEHSKQCLQEAVQQVAREIHAVISREGVEASEITSSAQIDGITVRVVNAFCERFGAPKTTLQIAVRQGAIQAICDDRRVASFMVVEAVAAEFARAGQKADT